MLAKQGVSFWVMQQDTFWRDDFFYHNLDKIYESKDILFDQLGDKQLGSVRGEWINGTAIFDAIQRQSAC